MSRFISAIALFLTSVLAHAQEAAVVPPPPVDSDPTAMLLFAALLFGSVAWFVWFIWNKEKQRRQQEGAAK